MFRRMLFLFGALVLLRTSNVDAEIPTDFLMNSDPEFRALDRIKDFKRDFKGIWLQALQRPEIDYQRKAAETVARAHEHGIPDLIELAPAMETILTHPESHPSARFAAARALIVLESRDSAAKLLDAGVNHGTQLRQLVEPALARWNFGPAASVWNKRLVEPRTLPRDLILALRGLGQIRDTTALPTASSIALNILRPDHIRLEAAAAAGEIADAGLENSARQLARETRSNPLINRLCAVKLLKNHSSESTRQLLIELAVDREPSIVSAALQRLNEIDPELVVPLAEPAMQNPDPYVRQAGANCFVLRASPERIPPLARLLGDDHPSVRKFVAENLRQLAENPQLAEVIRNEAMQVLSGDRWQGQEQAALVLGKLEHKPAADRFVELLQSERPEVMIAAAWGLRKLAEPHTVAAVVQMIKRRTVERRLRDIVGVDEQVAHLFELCGILNVKEAEPLMLEYVPKEAIRGERILSRGAAIWALGNLHAGIPDTSVADALIDRVLDDADRPPEIPYIKQMSAVALARMKAVDYVSSLKQSITQHTPASSLDLATRWAIRELSGEEIPAPVPQRYPDGEWFLEPLETSSASLP